MLNKELTMKGGGIKPEANLLGEVIIEDVVYLMVTPVQGLGYTWDWSYTQFPVFISEGSLNYNIMTVTLPDSPWQSTDGLSYLINIDASLYLTSSNPINTEPDLGPVTLTFGRTDEDISYCREFLAQFNENGKKINFWLGSKPDWL